MVGQVLRSARKRMRGHGPDDEVEPVVVGNDGLTDSERLVDLVHYRSGVGSRPAYSDEVRAKYDTMAEKLAGTASVHQPR